MGAPPSKILRLNPQVYSQKKNPPLFFPRVIHVFCRFSALCSVGWKPGKSDMYQVKNPFLCNMVFLFSAKMRWENEIEVYHKNKRSWKRCQGNIVNKKLQHVSGSIQQGVYLTSFFGFIWCTMIWLNIQGHDLRCNSTHMYLGLRPPNSG